MKPSRAQMALLGLGTQANYSRLVALRYLLCDAWKSDFGHLSSIWEVTAWETT
jgi:hypothetical protein